MVSTSVTKPEVHAEDCDSPRKSCYKNIVANDNVIATEGANVSSIAA